MTVDHATAILASLLEDDEGLVIAEADEGTPSAPRERLTLTEREALCFALGALATIHPTHRLGD